MRISQQFYFDTERKGKTATILTDFSNQDRTDLRKISSLWCR